MFYLKVNIALKVRRTLLWITPCKQSAARGYEEQVTLLSLVRGSASCLLSLQALPALSRDVARRVSTNTANKVEPCPNLGLTDILGLRVKPAMTNLTLLI
jgi:hypothetical protein